MKYKRYVGVWKMVKIPKIQNPAFFNFPSKLNTNFIHLITPKFEITICNYFIYVK